MRRLHTILYRQSEDELQRVCVSHMTIRSAYSRFHLYDHFPKYDVFGSLRFITFICDTLQR
jgi:hypothetical protein